MFQRISKIKDRMLHIKYDKVQSAPDHGMAQLDRRYGLPDSYGSVPFFYHFFESAHTIAIMPLVLVRYQQSNLPDLQLHYSYPAQTINHVHLDHIATRSAEHVF